MQPGTAGKPVSIGVPYGSRARLILIFLQLEAIRTRSREIELGNSLRTWLKRLGIPQGGSSIATVRDQAECLSLCRLTFHIRAAEATGLLNQSIVDTALFLDEPDDGQFAKRRPQFMERVTLSTRFFEQLQIPGAAGRISHKGSGQQQPSARCLRLVGIPLTQSYGPTTSTLESANHNSVPVLDDSITSGCGSYQTSS